MNDRPLVKCPICGVSVREERLESHLTKQHRSDIVMKRSDSLQTPYKQPITPNHIRTKLVREIKPGKFIALGYGDISSSELQVVVISSFLERHFTPDSAIGSIDSKLGREFLFNNWPTDKQPGDTIVLFPHQSGINFKYLIILFTGYFEPRRLDDLNGGIDTWLPIGLSNVSANIGNLGSVNSIDVTALGTQYGGIERQKAFGIISEWALRLFEIVPSVNLIRMTANDIDTFVDFFESLYKLPDWQSSNSLGESISSLLSANLGHFANDVKTVLDSLRNNPPAAISWCRTIIERVVKEIYAQAKKQYPGNLSGAIDGLKSIVTFPPQFHAYLDVVRRLGNFTIHSDDLFEPSEKDAEIILSLTLRIIDYWETH